MQTELSYLLDELNMNWDQDKPIQVKDLIRMINKSFKAAEADEKQIQDSMNEIGHDMP